MKVLVVEDSVEIFETIKLCLSIRWPACVVLGTARGSEVTTLVEQESPDLVLLDLNLVDQNGMDALQELRRTTWVPVIIVSGRGDELTRIRGLEEGADDYIVKPFSHTELLARINAVLRRSGRSRSTEGPIVISGRDLVIDHEKRRLDVNGQPVDLTNTEWALLAYLVKNEGRTIPTQALATAVWGSSYVEGSAIRMCVRRLRLKLGDDTHNPEIIRSHRGVGYSFDPTREPNTV